MKIVLIRGAGDVGTATGIVLRSLGYGVIYTELPKPTVLRWAVAFAEAVYRGSWEIQGIRARFSCSAEEALKLVEEGEVAVLAPEGKALVEIQPQILIDARMAKRNLGTKMEEAPLVIGLGPGFTAGRDCHAVVETLEGPNLGRVILKGTAAPPTHRPCSISGLGEERLVRAPKDGEFCPLRTIGDLVQANEPVGKIDDLVLRAPIGGVIRGILHPGVFVRQGMKAVEIDPRSDPTIPFKISDRSLCIATGVVEALRLLSGTANSS
jgi:xanthine dehydrogenase accessory factor